MSLIVLHQFKFESYTLHEKYQILKKTGYEPQKAPEPNPNIFVKHMWIIMKNVKKNIRQNLLHFC